MTTPSESPRPALGELARLATAAAEMADAWPTADDPVLDDTFVREWAEFIAACSPAVILQLVALATGGAETAAFANGFIGWLGSGCNTRGQFPRTLSELSCDIHEFRARSLTPERPADA